MVCVSVCVMYAGHANEDIVDKMVVKFISRLTWISLQKIFMWHFHAVCAYFIHARDAIDVNLDMNE